MAVLNELDRFHLAMDAIDRMPELGDRAAHYRQDLQDQLIRHRQYVRTYGEDLPEVRDWQWTRGSSGATA